MTAEPSTPSPAVESVHQDDQIAVNAERSHGLMPHIASPAPIACTTTDARGSAERSGALITDERQLARVDRMVQLIDFNGDCWLWTGRTNDRGYGTYGQRLAYHLLFELFVEPVPAGLQIDHVCCVKACVNPDHLEVVTPSENVRRRWAQTKEARRAAAAEARRLQKPCACGCGKFPKKVGSRFVMGHVTAALSIEERIRTRTVADGECRLWTGSVNQAGWPWVRRHGRRVFLGRWLYEREYGPLTTTTTIEPRCGNRRCLNLEHLQALSRSELWKARHAA